MGIDEWIQTCIEQARSSGDRSRQRLYGLDHEGWAVREHDPPRSLAIYEQASRLAHQLEEPWWELYYDDWQVNALLFWLYDYRRGVERAVANMLKARKSMFDGCPIRYSVQFNLVDAYIGSDPLGYEPLIEESMHYLQRDCPLEGQEVYRLFKSWCEFELMLGRRDRARAWCERLLRHAEGDVHWYHADFHSGFALSRLCYLAHVENQPEQLPGWATLGVEAAARGNCQEAVAEFLLWQAIAARKQQREAEAQRLYRQSSRKMNALGVKPDWVHYRAEIVYHELAGEPARALAVRRSELATLSGSGRWGEETRCRLEICRQLAHTGVPWQEEAAALRQAAQHLKQPHVCLEALDELTRTHGPKLA